MGQQKKPKGYKGHPWPGAKNACTILTRKRKKERKKVKVFIIRIITNIVGETTRVGCEAHG